MPRVPTAPLPELTVRGTKRKNRLFTPEEDIQKALDLVRQGVFVLRAARLCGVPDKRMQARVKELRDRGELDIFWGKNAPGYLAQLEKEKAQQEGVAIEVPTENEGAVEEATDSKAGPDGEKKGKKKKKKGKGSRGPYPTFTAESAYAAAEAVREGLYTLNAAHNIFQCPRSVIGRVLKGETITGREARPVEEQSEVVKQESEFVKIMGKLAHNPNEPYNWRHVKKSKLSMEEEQLIVNYALALYNLHHPVTLKSIFPLANRLLEERDQCVRDPHCWFKAFCTRHPELEDKHISGTQMYKFTHEHWVKQVLTRLTTVYNTHNFHVKPSRIYAWQSMQYNIERWEPEQTNVFPVDILVAANAVGYHILPPCVVYANEGSPDVPDFLGLPEAGFVASEPEEKSKKILTSAILVEWFRSVFLQYLPSRSAEDPVALILPGSYHWITPELVSLAEQNHVHLIPMNPKVLEQLCPLLIPLHQLKESYNNTLQKHREKHLAKQAKNPAEETFYPVKFRKMFSSCFSMYNIQEAFKTTGIFPLNPEMFQNDKVQMETMQMETDSSTPDSDAPEPIQKKSKKSSKGAPKKDYPCPKVIKYSDVDVTSEDLAIKCKEHLKKSSKKSTSAKGILRENLDSDVTYYVDIPLKSTSSGSRTSSKWRKVKLPKGSKPLPKGSKRLPDGSKPSRNVAIEILPVEGVPVKGIPVTLADGSSCTLFPKPTTTSAPSSSATCIIRSSRTVVSTAGTNLTPSGTSQGGEDGGISSQSGDSEKEATTSLKSDQASSSTWSPSPSKWREVKLPNTSKTPVDNVIVLNDPQSGIPVQGIPVTLSNGSKCIIFPKKTSSESEDGTTAGQSSSNPQVGKTSQSPTKSLSPSKSSSSNQPLGESDKLEILSKAFSSDVLQNVLSVNKPQEEQHGNTARLSTATGSLSPEQRSQTVSWQTLLDGCSSPSTTSLSTATASLSANTASLLPAATSVSTSSVGTGSSSISTARSSTIASLSPSVTESLASAIASMSTAISSAVDDATTDCNDQLVITFKEISDDSGVTDQQMATGLPPESPVVFVVSTTASKSTTNTNESKSAPGASKSQPVAVVSAPTGSKATAIIRLSTDVSTVSATSTVSSTGRETSNETSVSLKTVSNKSPKIIVSASPRREESSLQVVSPSMVDQSVLYQNAQILSSFAQQASGNTTAAARKPATSTPLNITLSTPPLAGQGMQVVYNVPTTAPLGTVLVPSSRQAPAALPTLLVNPVTSFLPTMIIPAGFTPTTVVSTSSAAPESNQSVTKPTSSSPDTSSAVVELTTTSEGSETSTMQSSKKQSSAVELATTSEGSKTFTMQSFVKQSSSSSDTQDPVSGTQSLESDVKTTGEDISSSAAVIELCEEITEVPSQSNVRKSPRKQTIVVKMDAETGSTKTVGDTDNSTNDNSPKSSPSPESRKRKASTSVSPHKKTEISTDQSKKVKVADVESGSSKRRVTTRAKSKEAASPSTRTRSMKPH